MAWKKAFVVGSAGMALLLSATIAAAQDAQVKRGQFLYQYRGCAGCHGMVEQPAAPSGMTVAPVLAGVTARRSNEWLHRWLKETDAMAHSDTVAMALVKQYKGAIMRIPKLSDDDINAILAFIKTKGG